MRISGSKYPLADISLETNDSQSEHDPNKAERLSAFSIKARRISNSFGQVAIFAIIAIIRRVANEPDCMLISLRGGVQRQIACHHREREHIAIHKVDLQTRNL